MAPTTDPKLSIEPLQICVHGVRGDAEFRGNGELDLVIKNCLYDLEFSGRQTK